MILDGVTAMTHMPMLHKICTSCCMYLPCALVYTLTDNFALYKSLLALTGLATLTQCQLNMFMS